MRTNLPFILHRRDLLLAVQGTAVTLRWTGWPAGTAVDPVTQSKVADGEHQPTDEALAVPAFIHFIQAASLNAVKQFNECELGDAILCLAPDVALDGKEDVRFTIDGSDWVQKPISEKLARSWEGIVQGAKFYRTVLVRRAT